MFASIGVVSFSEALRGLDLGFCLSGYGGVLFFKFVDVGVFGFPG